MNEHQEAVGSPASVHKGSGVAVSEGKWYIAECKPTRERTIRQLLQKSDYEAYVASQPVMRVYKSRNRRLVEKVIITGRVFVHTTEKQLMDIMLQFSSVYRFMQNRAAGVNEYGIRPYAYVTDQEMQYLQYMLNNAPNPVHITTDQLVLGQKIKVLRGPMAGFQGYFTKVANASCIVLKMEMGTSHYIYTEIPLEDVQPVDD